MKQILFLIALLFSIGVKAQDKYDLSKQLLLVEEREHIIVDDNHVIPTIKSWDLTNPDASDEEIREMLNKNFAELAKYYNYFTHCCVINGEKHTQLVIYIKPEIYRGKKRMIFVDAGDLIHYLDYNLSTRIIDLEENE